MRERPDAHTHKSHKHFWQYSSVWLRQRRSYLPFFGCTHLFSVPFRAGLSWAPPKFVSICSVSTKSKSFGLEKVKVYRMHPDKGTVLNIVEKIKWSATSCWKFLYDCFVRGLFGLGDDVNGWMTKRCCHITVVWFCLLIFCEWSYFSGMRGGLKPANVTLWWWWHTDYGWMHRVELCSCAMGWRLLAAVKDNYTS